MACKTGITRKQKKSIKMDKKEFFGTCIENPFDRIEELVKVTENSKEITKQTFLKHCFVENRVKKQMREYPNDFVFYKCIDKWYSYIYFFTHSAIDHFYE